MTDLTRLPPGLPRPEDDGATDHLPGMRMPPVALPGADGKVRRLDEAPTSRLVVFVYPRTGGPGVELPDGWDGIPGARGCTPQSCAFRDLHAELTALDATVWGVSAQPIEEQRDFAARMRLPYPLLNDTELRLAAAPLRLPTFVAAGSTLYARVTIVTIDARVARVFYPVFPPDRNAAEVVGYLRTLG